MQCLLTTFRRANSDQAKFMIERFKFRKKNSYPTRSVKKYLWYFEQPKIKDVRVIHTQTDQQLIFFFNGIIKGDSVKFLPRTERNRKTIFFLTVKMFALVLASSAAKNLTNSSSRYKRQLSIIYQPGFSFLLAPSIADQSRGFESQPPFFWRKPGVRRIFLAQFDEFITLLRLNRWRFKKNYSEKRLRNKKKTDSRKKIVENPVPGR